MLSDSGRPSANGSVSQKGASLQSQEVSNNAPQLPCSDLSLPGAAVYLWSLCRRPVAPVPSGPAPATRGLPKLVPVPLVGEGVPRCPGTRRHPGRALGSTTVPPPGGLFGAADESPRQVPAGRLAPDAPEARADEPTPWPPLASMATGRPPPRPRQRSAPANASRGECGGGNPAPPTPGLWPRGPAAATRRAWRAPAGGRAPGGFGCARGIRTRSRRLSRSPVAHRTGVAANAASWAWGALSFPAS